MRDWPACPTCQQPLPEKRPDCAECNLGWAFHEIRKDGSRGGVDVIAGPRGERVRCSGYRPREGAA